MRHGQHTDKRRLRDQSQKGGLVDGIPVNEKNGGERMAKRRDESDFVIKFRPPLTAACASHHIH